MFEFEKIMAPYEFEDRAHLFMANIVELSEKSPNLLVEAENKTIRDLEANSWVIKKSATLKKDEMNKKAFMRGCEMDIKSANETAVMVTVHGTRKGDVREFAKRVDTVAMQLRGAKSNNEDITSFDAPEDEFRYFTCLIYTFK